MDPIKVDFSGRGGEGKKAIVIPPEKAPLKIIISAILAVITGFVTYYFMLPPLSLKAIEFYYFIGIIFISFIVFLAVLSSAVQKPEYMPFVKKSATLPIIVILVIALIAAGGYVVGSQFFRAKSYSSIMDVSSEKEFDLEEPDFLNTVPKLDESASANLASRALSDLADLGYVSQFTVYPSYPQINYKGVSVRLASLQYANIIKWFTNKDDGLPGYIVIDVAHETTEFKKLDKSIRYSLADHFSRNIKRVIRFEYPGFIFSTPTLEIDESGNPYWICARIDKTIGLFGGRDVIGTVLVDAVTGECDYYDMDTVENDKSLSWIDRVYSSDIIIEQFDFYGKFQKGFWNSILGQDGCVETTDGYNYIAQSDDVWLYTGVTSVTNDQSVTGFVLVNQRTKETKFYSVNGAKESTAQTSAEGLVQQYEYNATFPLLLNIADEPTYFMSLKDTSDIVQMYAMINVKQYNKIKAVGDTLNECLEAYKTSLEKEGIKVDDDIVVPEDPTAPEAPSDIATISGFVSEIRSAVIGGDTFYYIKLSSMDTYYSISAAKCSDAVILNVGDSVEVTAAKSDGAIVALDSLKIVPVTTVPVSESTTAAAQ